MRSTTRDGTRQMAFLNEPNLDVVLQTQKDVAIADAGIMAGLQFRHLARSRFEALPEIAGLQHPPAIEGSRIAARPSWNRRMTKWPGKLTPSICQPWLRGMDIEDGERHGQTLAAVDHAHQIGILQIVIIHAVAAIGEFRRS